MSNKGTLLITPTLLDAVSWCKSCPASWKVKAQSSLAATIRREKYKANKQALRGIAFENTVYDLVKRNDYDSGTEHVQKVADMCRGGSFQNVLKRQIQLQGEDVVLYGKSDVMFLDKIVDIKTTDNWRGEGKYLKGMQHVIYTYIADITEFYYIVALFQKNTNDILNVYDIPYAVEEPEKQLEDIERRIIDAWEYLKDHGLWFDYCVIFSNNGGNK